MEPVRTTTPLRIGHALVALLIGLSGCASRPAPEPTAPAGPEPVVIGGENGLELRVWTVAIDPYAEEDPIASALSPYLADDGPWDAGATERWRTGGLRAVLVPLDEIGALRDALPLTGQIERRWIGQQAHWGALIRGAPLPAVTTLEGDHRGIVFRGGFLRLLVRSWTAPTPLGPRVVIGLALQHVDNKGPKDVFGQALRGMAVDPLDAGVVLRWLTVEGMFEQGAAIVVVAAATDEQWGVGEGGDPESARRSSFTPALPGPQAPRRKTLGEQLLHFERARNRPETRTMMLLLPRAPKQHSIAPM